MINNLWRKNLNLSILIKTETKRNISKEKLNILNHFKPKAKNLMVLWIPGLIKINLAPEESQGVVKVEVAKVMH